MSAPNGTATARSPAGAGADTAAARSALQAAIQALQGALASLDDPPSPEPDQPPAGQIGLEAFRWAGKGKKTADPSGLPQAYRWSDEAGGSTRYFQWKWPGFIIIGTAAAGAKSASGETVRWYHFTINGMPSPLLSRYGWQHTHTTPEGSLTWYRYKRVK